MRAWLGDCQNRTGLTRLIMTRLSTLGEGGDGGEGDGGKGDRGDDKCAMAKSKLFG